MKSITPNPKNLNKKTGNTLQNIVQKDIDEETKYVNEYFKANNIPFYIEMLEYSDPFEEMKFIIIE